jgi:hypothetical protein
MTVSPSPPVRPGADAGVRPERPSVTELRLSAFAGHRNAAFPLGPLTLLTGPSGSGKTTALRAYEALARLGGGARLDEAFPDPHGCVPEQARPDAQSRRGFRLGCTADGPEGPIRLDIAVQAEPELRIVGERLTSGGLTLLETALVDPSRPTTSSAPPCFPCASPARPTASAGSSPPPNRWWSPSARSSPATPVPAVCAPPYRSAPAASCAAATTSPTCCGARARSAVDAMRNS